MEKRAKIIGTGSYLPSKVLTNFDFEKMVDTSNEWIVTRTGVKERRLAAEGEFSSDMGAGAAKKAIADANLSIEDIDLIIVATLTPDYIFPSTACLIQSKLKAKNAAAFDFQAACSGYVYGLSLAKAMVEQKAFKNILFVATEKLSSIVDYEDRSTCVLFGDGAAATVISLEGQGYEILDVSLGADGDLSDLLMLPAGGSALPATEETIKERKHFIKMNGAETFKHAVRRMEGACKKSMQNLNLNETDISWLIPHQANDRIISAIAKRFSHLPSERVYRKVVEKFGNTSASSIGIAFDDLNKQGVINRGDNILMTAFGAGLTWGAAIIRKT